MFKGLVMQLSLVGRVEEVNEAGAVLIAPSQCVDLGARREGVTFHLFHQVTGPLRRRAWS